MSSGAIWQPRGGESAHAVKVGGGGGAGWNLLGVGQKGVGLEGGGGVEEWWRKPGEEIRMGQT